MDFNRYIYLSIGILCSAYVFFKYVNNKLKGKEEKIDNIDNIGFGFIADTYPILTIYINKKYINKNNINNLIQNLDLIKKIPQDMPDNSYLIISYDEKFKEYIGVITFDEFKEIKNIFIEGTSEELLLKIPNAKVNIDYYKTRIFYASSQIKYFKYLGFTA
jgi:hypothetical protein